MGVALGSHQQALHGWGEVYGRTPGTLHGGEADPAGAYREVLLLVRELLVPLPGWADPRATGFFFGSRPAAAWLKALQEHTPTFC